MRKLIVLVFCSTLFLCAAAQYHVLIRCEVLIVQADAKTIHARRLDNNYIFHFNVSKRDLDKIKFGSLINVNFDDNKVITRDNLTIPVSGIENNILDAKLFSALYCINLPESIAGRGMASAMRIGPIRANPSLAPKNVVPVVNPNEVTGTSNATQRACCEEGNNSGVEFSLAEFRPDDIDPLVYVCNNWVFANPKNSSLPGPLIFPVVGRWTDAAKNKPDN